MVVYLHYYYYDPHQSIQRLSLTAVFIVWCLLWFIPTFTLSWQEQTPDKEYKGQYCPCLIYLLLDSILFSLLHSLFIIVLNTSATIRDRLSINCFIDLPHPIILYIFWEYIRFWILYLYFLFGGLSFKLWTSCRESISINHQHSL